MSKTKNAKFKNMLNSAQFKKGSYSSVIIVIIVAIVVALNFLVQKLPTSAKNIDISDTKIYSIGAVTEGVLESLNHDVNIIVVAEEDAIDTRIDNFINLYADKSKHITVTHKDPALYPSVLTDYDISKNTVVITCPDTDKTETVAFTDIIQYDQSYYYYYGQQVESAFDGEGQLTSAIDYVASDSNKTLYTLAGHGEAELGTNISESIDKSNFTVAELNLLTAADGIPEDCSMIIINQPTKDLADDELNSLQEYMNKGGNILLLLADTSDELGNVNSLMEGYGIKADDGYIGDSTRYNSYDQSYFSCFPKYSTGDITGSLNDSSDLSLVQNSVGLIVTDTENVSVDKFLTTSEGGLKYVSGATDYETGTYTYAAAATVTIPAESDDEENITAHLTVYGCPSIIDDDIISHYSGTANTDIFINSITADFEDVNNISIDSVSLAMSYNTFTNTKPVSIFFIGVIPVVLIAAGFVRWLRRRKL